MPKAAAEAMAPMRAVYNALMKGRLPVNQPFAYPTVAELLGLVRRMRSPRPELSA